MPKSKYTSDLIIATGYVQKQSSMLLATIAKELMNSDLWRAIREFDPALYRRLRRNPLGRVTCLPGRAGERLLVFFYRFGRRMIKF